MALGLLPYDADCIVAVQVKLVHASVCPTKCPLTKLGTLEQARRQARATDHGLQVSVCIRGPVSLSVMASHPHI
jgi:hypothetical protein